MSQASAALCTAASQNLAAVLGGHALAETMLLGALTLLGLIGTNHCLYTSCTVVAAVPPVHNSEIAAVFKKYYANFQRASYYTSYFNEKSTEFLILFHTFSSHTRYCVSPNFYPQKPILLYNVFPQKR